MTQKKKKPPTRRQIGRIVNMLLSGEIDRIEATAIIEIDRKQDINLAFWGSRFPGKGEALMEVLRPFYDWKPELKPALPDLEEQAKRAVFWGDVSNMRVSRVSEATTLWNSLEDPLASSLEGSFWDSLEDSLEDPFEGSFWASLEDSFRASLGVSLGVSLWNSLEGSFWDSLEDSLEDPFEGSFWDSLRVSLIYACCFILADKPEEAAKLKPLLDLWLAGNFPVGFDENGNLLVLVADSESE